MIKPRKPLFMTESGIKKSREELETLMQVTRPQVFEYLADAKDGGDSADNTEYLFLSQEIREIDRCIREHQYCLEHYQLIERASSNDRVVLGSGVVNQEPEGSPESFFIVGSVEANPSPGINSDESPLGKSLLNHKIGDEITVDTPKGQISYRILDIG